MIHRTPPEAKLTHDECKQLDAAQFAIGNPIAYIKIDQDGLVRAGHMVRQAIINYICNSYAPFTADIKRINKSTYAVKVEKVVPIGGTGARDAIKAMMWEQFDSLDILLYRKQILNRDESYATLALDYNDADVTLQAKKYASAALDFYPVLKREVIERW